MALRTITGQLASWGSIEENQNGADDQLVLKRTKDRPQDISREQIARLERELAAAQKRTKYIEESYGEDVLELTIAKAYLSKWLKKPSIVLWLQENQPEYLAEFQEVAEMTSLASSANVTPTSYLTD